MSKKRYFYWDEPADKAQGPAQLPVIAVLYKQGNIAGTTYVCVEGTEDWFPLSQLPEYSMLAEIAPEGAQVLMPSQAAAQEKEQAREGTIKILEKVVLIVLGVLAGCALSAIVGFMLPSAVIPAVLVLGCISMVGWVLIIMPAFDEGMKAVAIVVLVPFGDIYYALTNIDRLLWPLVVRYAAGFAAGAFAMGALVNEIVNNGTASGAL